MAYENCRITCISSMIGDIIVKSFISINAYNEHDFFEIKSLI